MSTGGEIVFFVAGMAAVLFAVLTVVARSPLRAALSLLGNILSLAALYLTLHAHLLAAVQVLVYAGAVVVLFIFVIMLIGPSSMPTSKEPQRGLVVRSIGASLMALVAGGVAFNVAQVDRPYVDSNQCGDPTIAECGQFGGVQAISQALYVDAAVPFELISVLLLVAIIAAVAVARGHSPAEKRALEARREAADAAASAEET